MRFLALATTLILCVGPLVADEPATVAEPPKPAAKADAAAKPAADREAIRKAIADAKRFLRIKTDGKGDVKALQTSITRYESERYPGVAVDLIGVVHVADKAYYQRLNKIFEQYDALLYELVAPNGTRPAAGRGGGSPVSGMQRMMKSMLDLEFQLDMVDYSKRNFVHADMSPEEFSKSMQDRGESFFQLFMRMMGQSMAQQGAGSTDVQFLFAFMSKDRPAKLKTVMAQQFQEMEATIYALSGPDGTTIIQERNKKALDVLRSEMEKGKRRLAIFYGAGHLPDMERRLEGDFGFRPRGAQWLTAWDLSD